MIEELLKTILVSFLPNARQLPQDVRERGGNLI